jgi:hypothetical protein
MEIKNNKQIGEIGERVAIGELSKFGLDILLPMSDNLPYDFVVYLNNKFYKCQVKSTNSRDKEGSWRFSLTSNNWNKGIVHEYTKNDVDIIICCNLSQIFLFTFEEIEGKKNIYIRDTPPKNNQTKGINLSDDYIISEERILKVFK